MDSTNKYDDIINLEHHVSKKYPQMSLENRSAQFAPFSALTGYAEIIKEKGRLTSVRKEMNEELKNILDLKLKIILDNIYLKPTISVTYFIADHKKSGGEYITATGNVKKVDGFKKLIILENNTKIPILDIIEINGEILKGKGLE